MKDSQKHIEDIFKEAFADHEMDVSSRVWEGVQSSLGAQAAATSGAADSGSSMLSGMAAVTVSALVLTGSVNEVRNMQPETSIEPAVQVESVEVTAPNTPEATISYQEAVGADEPASKATSSSEQDIAAIEKEVQTTSTPTANQPEEPKTSPMTASAGAKEEHEDPQPQPQPKANEAESKTDPKRTQPEPRAYAADEKDEPQTEEESDAANVESDNKQAGPGCIAQISVPDDYRISPNGDGHNDCFEVEYVRNVSEFRVYVHDRAGRRVFSSTETTFQWCGDDAQNDQQLGTVQTYFYVIEAIDDNGVPFIKKAYITVYR